MSVWTQESKNTAAFLNLLKHGNESLLSDLANFTFEDVVFSSGEKLKDITFDQLVGQVWSNLSKNSAVFTNETKH